MLLSFYSRRWLRLLLLISLAAASTVKSEQELVDPDVDVGSSPPRDLQGVITLTDETFEHQTQASTGQTTGSWLVWFYDDANDHVTGSFPSESEWLEDHIVVGAVNVAEGAGAKLKKRFALEKLPVFLYFHKGKMYRYSTSTFANDGLSWEAVREFCKNPDASLAESIQPPLSFFSEMWTGFQNSREYPFLVEAGTYYVKVMAGLGVFFVVGLSIKAIFRRINGSSGRKEKSE